MWFTKRIKFGFLIGEFKPKFYFWGFIKIYKNLIIISTTVLSVDNYIRNMVILYLIILIYRIKIYKLKPYKMIYFNKKD